MSHARKPFSPELLVIAAIIFLLFASCGPRRNYWYPHNEPASYVHSTTDPPRALPQRHTNANQEQERPTDSGDENCMDIKTIADLILAVVGIGGVIVAAWSLTVLQEQSEATKKAAEAALLNAQAVIGAERPWLLLTTADRSAEKVEGKNDSVLSAFFRLKNFGQTPAFIVSITGGVVIRESYDTQWLTDQDYKAPYAGQDESILAPGQETDGTKFKLSEYVATDFNECCSGKKHFILYGKIEYRDTFPDSKIHLSKFCYRYSFGMYAGGFRFMCGGKTDNEYT